MKTIPRIGERVRYTRAHVLPARTCAGTVVAQFRGGFEWVDDEGVSRITPDAVCVRVDEPLPEWWPYDGTNRFAPDVAEVEPLNPKNRKERSED